MEIIYRDSNNIRFTVTFDGKIRLKIPQNVKSDEIELFKKIGERVIQDNYGKTLRGHLSYYEEAPNIRSNTIVLYTDNKKTYYTYNLGL